MATVSTHVVQNSTTGATTPAIDTTGKTCIVVCTAAFHASITDATTTITDNKSNTYTLVGKSSLANSQWAGIYICTNPTVGTGHTWTYNLTALTDVDFGVLAFDDISSPAVDQGGSSTFSTGGAAANTAVTTPQITTVAATEYLVSVYTNDDGADTVTLANGGSSSATWTKDIENDGGVGVCLRIGHAVVSATGTFSASWTSNNATTVAPKGIASIKTASAGFDPSTVPWSAEAPSAPGVAVVGF
jgi:hypothetical protein